MVKYFTGDLGRRDLGFGLIYTLLLVLSLSFIHATSGTAIIWPVGGFLMGSLVVAPRARWGWRLGLAWAITLPLEVVGLGRSPLLVLVFLSLNTLEAVLGALWMRRYGGGAQGFASLQQVVAFLLGVGVVLPWLTAIPAAWGVVLLTEAEDWWAVHQAWSSAVGLGLIFVAPGVVVCHHQGRLWLGREPWRWAEFLGLLALAVGMAWVQFCAWEQPTGDLVSAMPILHHPYTILPLLMWAGLRFNLLGVYVIGFAWVMVAIGRLTLTEGLLDLGVQENLVTFQGVVAVVALPAIGFTVAHWQNKGSVRQRIQADTLAEQSRQQAQEAESQLFLQVRRAEALLDLPAAAETLDEADFMQHGQELAEDLTASQIAFIHFINHDQETIEMVAWSRRTLSHYCQATYDRHYPVSQAGIWADALRQKHPVVVNNYAAYAHKQGLPEGHAPLDRLLTVPVVENGQVVMLTGVGNKAEQYTDTDVETVQLIANEIWRLVQRRRALVQLAHSEQRLREAQRVANIGSWDLDHTTGELLWSDQVFRIFEISPPDFNGTYGRFLDFVHPEDRDRVHQTYQQALAQSSRYHCIHRILTPQGQIKHVHERGETHYDDNGRPLRSLGTIQDITGQVLSSERLQQAAAVFESTLEGVMITDLQGRILDVNQAFETITGYHATEAIGQTSRLLKSGHHDARFYQSLWQTLVTQGTWHGEIWNRRKNGEIYPSLLTITTVRNGENQPTGYVGVFSDITTTKESQDRLDHLAHHNPLTGLPNRLLFNDRLHHALNLATRQGTLLALIFVDVDRFKHINDSMGHGAGDALLRQLAQRFQEAMRTNDTVAHLSGDEFVVLLEDVAHTQNVTLVIHKLFEALKAPVQLQGQEIYVTASMGVSLFPSDGQDPAILLRNADTAMYQAKEEGRNTYRFYTEEMTAITFEQMLLENALRGALDRQEFHLVYQPQVDLISRRLVGLEVLLRWQHPDLGLVSPVQFIPLAEQTGLIRDIGLWVLHSACRQGREWLDRGFSFGRIAVNIAGPQIRHNGLLEVVQSALDASGLPSTYLELEVTEGFIMEGAKDSVEQLKALRDLGIQISIDDFGTGYSSLSYLKQLPIEKLKIDRSFIRDIPEDANDMAIAEAVIALGHALNLRVIAEGVETEAQATFLIKKGCHEAQGYLYSQPLIPQNIHAILARQYL